MPNKTIKKKSKETFIIIPAIEKAFPVPLHFFDFEKPIKENTKLQIDTIADKSQKIASIPDSVSGVKIKIKNINIETKDKTKPAIEKLFFTSFLILELSIDLPQLPQKNPLLSNSFPQKIQNLDIKSLLNKIIILYLKKFNKYSLCIKKTYFSII